jgi:general secretion pathway protein N
MFAWLRPTGLAVLCAVLGVAEISAATSSRMDILSDDAVSSPAESVDVGAVRPIARPAQATSKPAPRGNPLWSVPLSALTVTQERPIFSAMRRPPPRAVAASPVEEAHLPPPKPVDAPPPLMLVGAVVGEGDAIAILVNRTDQKVVRLRQGESLDGWSLTSVQPREVTLKQGDRSEVLALQRPEAAAAPGIPAPPADAGGKLTMPTTANTSFAPFVPRSVPKNGESDGL